MEEATGAPSSLADWDPKRLRASSRDGETVMTESPSPLTMLLSRHTRRREFITLIGGAARVARRPDPTDKPSLQTATRLSNDPQWYWQPPRRPLLSRGVLVCRRHFRFFQQVDDTSPPRAGGNHPNPCLPLRGKPLLLAQATRTGFARRSASIIQPQPLRDLPQQDT